MDFSSSVVCTIVIVLGEGIGNYDFLNCFSGTYAVPSMVSPTSTALWTELTAKMGTISNDCRSSVIDVIYIDCSVSAFIYIHSRTKIRCTLVKRRTLTKQLSVLILEEDKANIPTFQLFLGKWTEAE